MKIKTACMRWHQAVCKLGVFLPTDNTITFLELGFLVPHGPRDQHTSCSAIRVYTKHLDKNSEYIIQQHVITTSIIPRTSTLIYPATFIVNHKHVASIEAWSQPRFPSTQFCMSRSSYRLEFLNTFPM